MKPNKNFPCKKVIYYEISSDNETDDNDESNEYLTDYHNNIHYVKDDYKPNVIILSTLYFILKAFEMLKIFFRLTDVLKIFVRHFYR
jgi:hypothetical protein